MIALDSQPGSRQGGSAVFAISVTPESMAWIGGYDSLGCWLYLDARRVAAQARARSERSR
jgi:hypothetical protein